MHAFWWESVYALLVNNKRKITLTIDAGYCIPNTPYKIWRTNKWWCKLILAKVFLKDFS